MTEATTFSDALITFFVKCKLRSETITKLQKYIKEEEYETDSILIDIEDNILNLLHQMNDKKATFLINQFIQTHFSMSLYLD